jgi:hypothetical protein
MFLRNVSWNLTDYTTSYSRRWYLSSDRIAGSAFKIRVGDLPKRKYNFLNSWNVQYEIIGKAMVPCT